MSLNPFFLGVASGWKVDLKELYTSKVRAETWLNLSDAHNTSLQIGIASFLTQGAHTHTKKAVKLLSVVTR